MTPPTYFIVLASSVKTKEVKVIEFYRIVCTSNKQPEGDKRLICYIGFILIVHTYLNDLHPQLCVDLARHNFKWFL